MNTSDIISKEARLIVLRELQVQPGYALNDAMLQAVLETFGITRSREWLREELRAMVELGAITVRDAGSVRIAVLSDKGRDHVEQRVAIEGIKRPGPRG